MTNIIELRAVSWHRGSDQILRDVDWTICPGQHWALLGPNGAGKSSLLNIINGYQWPSSGTVSVLGHPFGTVDLRELRHHIGWISSAVTDWLVTHHPGDTVEALIWGGFEGRLMGLPSATHVMKTRTHEVMERLGLSAMAHRMLAQLSQGQKQKVLLARAWVAELRLLILDEPTQGLDLRGREQFLEDLSHLVEQDGGPSVIYVTHQTEEIMPWITHALLLSQGRRQIAGSKADVLNDADLSRCYDVPVRVDWYQGRPWIRVTKSS